MTDCTQAEKFADLVREVEFDRNDAAWDERPQQIAAHNRKPEKPE